jgi:hypothetical protein
MADIIPRVRGPEVQIERGPIVRADARLDTSGGNAMAAALGQASGVVEKFAEQQQEINDTTALMAARRQLSDWEGRTFDPSNPDGVQKFRGKNALGANDALLPDLDQVVGKIEGELTGRQKQRFAGVALQFRESVQGRLNGHADREFTMFREAEQKAAVDNLGRDAVSAGLAGDMDRQELVLAELVGMNRARREAEGMGEQFIEAEQAGIVSAVSRQTIEGLATADPFAAQELFERRVDMLTPEDRQQVEKSLFPVMADAAAEAAVDAILAGGTFEADDPGTVDSQIIALESAGKADAENPNSTATGAGQFLESTWLEVVQRHRPELAEGRAREEVLALRRDPAVAAEMVTRYREDNARHLARNGVAPTATNLYAAHHFGPAGGVRFAKLDDGAPMTAVLSPSEIAANPYLRGKTVGDTKADWRRRGLASGGDPVQASGPPTSEAEALDRIRAGVRDPRLRATMMAKVRERYGIQEMREREQTKARDEATNLALSNGDPTKPLRELIGADAYAQYEREGKIDTLESIRMKRIQGGFVQDDPVLVEEISREAVTNPAAFARRNFDDPDLQAKMSTSTLAEFKKMAADGAKAETRADWMTSDQRVSRAFTSLGIDSIGDAAGRGSEKKNVERKTARGEFRIAYADARRTWMQANPGKKPPPEVEDSLLQSTIRNFAERQKQGRTGMYSSALRFQADISQPDRTAVRNAYIAKYGVAPTDAWVTAYFARRDMAATNE